MKPTLEKIRAFIGTVSKSISGCWSHMTEWAEAYFWIPIIAFLIVFAAKFVALLTHRKTACADAETILAVFVKLLVVIVIAVGASIVKTALGHWITREEAAGSKHVAILDKVETLAILAGVAYIVLH